VKRHAVQLDLLAALDRRPARDRRLDGLFKGSGGGAGISKRSLAAITLLNAVQVSATRLEWLEHPFLLEAEAMSRGMARLRALHPGCWPRRRG
jgi:hypothetical protein